MEKVYCQSCGMPLKDEKLFGTEKGELKSSEYCIYCYENGSFKQPELTMEDMIKICIPHMIESGIKEEEARTMLNKFLPQLKRWKKEA